MNTQERFEVTSEGHVIFTRRMHLDDFKKQYPESYESYVEGEKKKGKTPQ